MEMPYTCEVQLSFCNCTLSVSCGFIDKKGKFGGHFLVTGYQDPLASIKFTSLWPQSFKTPY